MPKSPEGGETAVERDFVFNVRTVYDCEVTVTTTSRKRARAILSDQTDPRVSVNDPHSSAQTVRFLREEPAHD